MDLKSIHPSKTIRGVVIGLVVLIIVLGILQAGIAIGYRQARFAGQFGMNFEKNFIGGRRGMDTVFFNRELPGGHGTIGEIIGMNLPLIIVTGPDKLEKTIRIGTSTLVRHYHDEIRSSDLKVGDFVVILGNPNDSGQIEARLIRIMPLPAADPVKIKR